MKIDSTDKTIESLVQGSFFSIPRFQRPYSWEKEHIEDFWRDAVQDVDSEYFIGSMVAYSESADTYGLVDGQQRLTTIVMLLSAIRNQMDQEGFHSLADGLHNLIERRDKNNALRHLLKTETSYPFLSDVILKFRDRENQINEVSPNEESALIDAFDQLSAFVREAVRSIKNDKSIPAAELEEHIEAELKRIRDKVLGLKVIFVELDNEDDAYIIFETLNTRGKDLSVGDLVKAHLTKQIGTNVTDSVQIKWMSLVETLEGSEFDLKLETFLHHYWLSNHDYITLKRLYKQIKQTVKRAGARQFLESLRTDAVTYRRLFDYEFGRKWKNEEKPVRRSLGALKLFKVKQPVPYMLSLMRAYESDELKLAQVRKSIRALENFHFSFTAITSQRSSGGIAQMYAKAARELTGAETPDERINRIEELRQKLKQKRPSFDEFRVQFREVHYTKNVTKYRALVKYILSELYGQMFPALKLDYDSLSIEHLLPQSILSSGDEDDATVGQLGNLVLVSAEVNSKLGTKAFGDKITLLKQHQMPVDEWVSQQTSWDATTIRARTDQLAEYAYKHVWHL